MSSPGSIQKGGVPLGVTGQLKRIAVIPAKLKSKRCEGKNWRPFIGEASLAQIAFDKAVGSGYFEKTVLSIDFPIKKVEFLKKPRNSAMKMGVSVRVRPRFLGKSSEDVAIDALKSVGAEPYDIYVLLQPTSPFVSKESIWRAIQTVQSSKGFGRTSVVSVNEFYKPNGAIYAGRCEDLFQYKSFYKPFVTPLVLNSFESIDIDYEYDYEIARCLLE